MGRDRVGVVVAIDGSDEAGVSEVEMEDCGGVGQLGGQRSDAK